MSQFFPLASVLLLVNLAFARPAPQCGGHSVWDVCIWEGPAPSPEDGPPLSANALRDTSKLKYEIIGIVGAYALWVLVSFILIFSIGRRLRRKAQTSNRTLSMEMISRGVMTKEQIPAGGLSPGKMASLKAWASGGKSHSHKQSEVTVSTINENQVEMDKQRNMEEMTNLYAAVMAHDEARSQNTKPSNQTSPRSPQFPQGNGISINRAGQPTPPISPRYPPEFQHLRSAVVQAQTNPHSLNHSMAPTPTSEDPQSTSTSRSSYRARTSPKSFVSTSKSVKSRPGHISVRGMPISQPIGSADLANSSQYSDETPLSPRLYNPGPPPPTPGQRSAAAQSRQLEAVKPARHTPAVLSLSSQTPTVNNSSNNSLPFRQMYQESMKSAPATKTTFLDKRETMIGSHPKTGVPQTPYSPYTPFTPMTPMTPRTMMTRKELKKQKKEQGLKVLSEDDMVKSDEDMWA